MSSVINWKSRYVELLDQQEKQQLRYKRKNALLSEALSDAATLARGLDKGTDEKMLALQALLRREKLINVDLEAAVQALSRQTKLSLAQREEALKNLLSDMQRVSRQTRDAISDKTTVRVLKEYEKNLKLKSKQFSDVPLLLSQLVALHRKSIQQLVNEGGSKTSFLGGLFVKADTRSEELDMQGAPAQETGLVPQSVDACDRQLLAELKRLLEQTIGFEGLEAKHGELYGMLGLDLTIEQLSDVMAAICDAVIAALENDQADFEAFLSLINDRLQEASSSLRKTQSINEQGQGAGQAFTHAMQENIGRIHSFISQTPDLDTLKREVSDNVDQMMKTVTTHLLAEHDRQDALGEELEGLTEKIAQMEQALVVSASKLKAQQLAARTDPLTRLPNREAYNERAEEEIARWTRHNRPLSIAVCDIDFFKKVNDNYGHACGDEVLVGVATCLKKRLRENDFVARFGGEEFVLLLPETTGEQAMSVMDSLREVVAKQGFEHETEAFNITISIGICQFQGKDNLESAFTRADKSLYEAKSNGRNQCRLAAKN